MDKLSKDLASGTEARKHVPKSDFVFKAKSVEGHSEEKGKYPIPDKAHARAAEGFCAMHHGANSSECKAVQRKVHEKFGEAMQRGFIKRAMEYGLTEKQALDVMPMLKTVGRGLGKATIPASAFGLGIGTGLGYGAANVGNKLYDKVVFQNHIPEKVNNIADNLTRASEQLSGTPADPAHNIEAQPGLIDQGGKALDSFSKFLSNPWVKYPTIASGVTLAAWPMIAAYNDYKERQFKEKHNKVLDQLLQRMK